MLPWQSALPFSPRWFVGSSRRRQTPRQARPTRIIQRERAAMKVKSTNICQLYHDHDDESEAYFCLSAFQERPRVAFCTTSTCCWSTTALCSARASSSSTCGKCPRRARRAAAASTRTSSPQPPTQTRPQRWPSPFYWISTATPWCCPRVGTWVETSELGGRKRRAGSEVRERCQTTWRNSLRLSWLPTPCTRSVLRTKSCCGTSDMSVCATPGIYF